MMLAGTIVNGQVHLDRPADLPDGTRVDLLPHDDEDDPVPAPTETYARHLALLRESIDEMNAGRTRPARDALREIAVRHGLPLLPGE